MALFPGLRQRASQAATNALGAITRMATSDVEIIPDELKPILRIDDAEEARQKEVIQAREYHEGRQLLKLTKYLKDQLGDDAANSLNFTATVTLAVAEKMLVDGVRVAAENANISETEKAAQEAFFARTWRENRLGFKHQDILEAALRDGEHFVIRDWDNENQRVRFTPHKRYTDPKVSWQGVAGDGEGVRHVYPNNDPNQKPLYSVKRWFEMVDNRRTPHVTVYHPGEVVTFARSGLGGSRWIELSRVDWTNAAGEPLGIPVYVFRNVDGRPEARRGWFPQRCINWLASTFLQTAGVAAFRVWLFFGWEPKDSSGNFLTISPNSWIGDKTKKPDDASATPVEPSDMAPLAEGLDSWIMKLAQLTDTPVSRLLITRQVSAEGTQKQGEEPLLAKIRRRAAMFGAAFEDLFAGARRLENAFGSGPGHVTLDESALLECAWQPFTARSLDEDLKEQLIEKTKAETQILKGQRGVSQTQSQRELNYSAKQIAEMKTEREDEATASQASLAGLFNSGSV